MTQNRVTGPQDEALESALWPAGLCFFFSAVVGVPLGAPASVLIQSCQCYDVASTRRAARDYTAQLERRMFSSMKEPNGILMVLGIGLMNYLNGPSSEANTLQFLRCAAD